jgi:TolA-binding protein
MGKVRYRNEDKIARILFLIMLVFSLIVAHRADAAEESERELFVKAYEYYLEYRPDIAAPAFGFFLERFDRSPARDAALFWQAKSLSLTGKQAEAKNIFELIKTEYPDSPFAEFARRELDVFASARERAREKKQDRDEKAGDADGAMGVQPEKSAAGGKDPGGDLEYLSEKNRVLKEDLARTVDELAKTRKERDGIAAKLKEMERRLSGMNDLATRLREGGRLQKEQDEFIENLKKEVGDLRGALREKEGKLSEAEETIAFLKTRPSGITLDNKPAGNNRPQETPRVRIGTKIFTMTDIAEESRIAESALTKIGASAFWRAGDNYEDFVTARLLAVRATESERRDASRELETYAKKYSLTAREKDYLSLYLTAEEVIERKKAGYVPPEKDLRGYYEAHRREYLKKKEERFVTYLVMKLRKGNKTRDIELVSELQREAGRGRSFGEIARLHADRISLREVTLEGLPRWIREKIRVLKDGELSSIFTEEQFIMLRMHVKPPVYRKYEEVSKEIIKKMSPPAGNSDDLVAWLAYLRKEAVRVK